MISALLQQTDLRRAGRRGSVALFAFAARATEQVANLVITLLAARFLVPAEYGLFSLANVFVILIQTLTYTGVYQFILTSKDDEDLILPTCFWLITGLVTLASLVLALAAYPLQWLFDAPELARVLLLLAAIQPLSGAVAWSSAALLRRAAIVQNYACVFSQNLIALVSSAALLWFWHSLNALIAAQYLRILTGTVLFVGFGRTWPGIQFRKSLAIKAAAFSGSLYSSRFLAFLARYAGDIMLGLFHSPTEVGLYRFGTRIATAATDTLTQPMSNFASTQFGTASRQDRDLAAPLARFTGTNTLLTGMLGVVIIVFAGEALGMFFQPTYATALVVTYAMALRGTAGVGQLLMEPVFSALGRPNWVVMFNLISAIVATAAIVAASPFGLEALAWTQLAAVVGATAWALYLIREKGGVHITPAIRSGLRALLLVVPYGLMLHAAHHWALPLLPISPMARLVAGLCLAGLLAVVFLALGRLLHVFSLHVFSG